MFVLLLNSSETSQTYMFNVYLQILHGENYAESYLEENLHRQERVIIIAEVYRCS